MLYHRFYESPSTRTSLKLLWNQLEVKMKLSIGNHLRIPNQNCKQMISTSTVLISQSPPLLLSISTKTWERSSYTCYKVTMRRSQTPSSNSSSQPIRTSLASMCHMLTRVFSSATVTYHTSHQNTFTTAQSDGAVSLDRRIRTRRCSSWTKFWSL